jgi:hypothetical protein
LNVKEAGVIWARFTVAEPQEDPLVTFLHTAEPNVRGAVLGALQLKRGLELPLSEREHRLYEALLAEYQASPLYNPEAAARDQRKLESSFGGAPGVPARELLAEQLRNFDIAEAVIQPRSLESLLEDLSRVVKSLRKNPETKRELRDARKLLASLAANFDSGQAFAQTAEPEAKAIAVLLLRLKSQVIGVKLLPEETRLQKALSEGQKPAKPGNAEREREGLRAIQKAVLAEVRRTGEAIPPDKLLLSGPKARAEWENANIAALVQLPFFHEGVKSYLSASTGESRAERKAGAAARELISSVARRFV